MKYVHTNPGQGSGLNLIVRNRYDVEAFPPPIAMPYVVVSVYTPGDTRPNLAEHEYLAESIAIPFYDVPYEPEDVHAEVRKHLFSSADAQAIAAFVKTAKARGIATVVVHCDMGKSRSSAIAAALSLYYNGTVQPFVKGKRYHPVGRPYSFETYTPNPRVFRLMVDALFERNSAKKNPPTSLLTDEVLMKGLATFEALRRLGFESDDIYYAMTPDFQGDYFVVQLKTQGKVFTITVGEVDRATWVDRWTDAGNWWNNATDTEMDYVWQRWHPPNELIAALLAKGFVFPYSTLPTTLLNPQKANLSLV